METLLKQLPGREQLAQWLIGMIGEGDEPSESAIFLCGPPSSGKSHVTASVLNWLKVTHVVVNCIECYVPRLLFEPVLQHIEGLPLSSIDNYQSAVKCDDLNSFVHALKKTVPRLKDQKLILVLDKAERLHSMDSSLLPGLLRLAQFTGLNVGVVLISVVPWDSYFLSSGSMQPLQLRFAQYNKEEMTEILARDCPLDVEKEYYRNYLKLVMSVFYIICRSLSDLRYMATLHFPKYREPVDRDEADWCEIRVLWRNLEPHLRRSIQSVYLKEGASSSSTATSKSAGLELPYYSKFLLLAAFLASHNPPKSDRRFFMKNHGRQKKRLERKKRKNMVVHLVGPRLFPLERLMAIFHSIVEEKVSSTALLLSQVSTLVGLKLLTQAKRGRLLDSPKYKCTVDLEFVKSIAKTVNFEVVNYLYEEY